MLKQYKLRNYNFRLVIYVIALTILGIMVIGSARESVQNKQILGLFLGAIAMICVSMMDYSFILKFSWLYYFFNIVLLLLVSVMETIQTVLPDGLILEDFVFSLLNFQKSFLFCFLHIFL